MSEDQRNNVHPVMSPTYPDKILRWSIEFDSHLRELFSLEKIENPDDQMKILGLLMRVGLAKHHLFGDNTNALHVQEHYYASTKLMRRIMRGSQL